MDNSNSPTDVYAPDSLLNPVVNTLQTQVDPYDPPTTQSLISYIEQLDQTDNDKNKQTLLKLSIGNK